MLPSIHKERIHEVSCLTIVFDRDLPFMDTEFQALRVATYALSQAIVVFEGNYVFLVNDFVSVHFKLPWTTVKLI